MRIFPDDIAVHTHEPALTENEKIDGASFWAETTAAGNDDALKRGAWKALARRHGSPRAAWIAKTLAPTLPQTAAAAAPSSPDYVSAALSESRPPPVARRPFGVLVQLDKSRQRGRDRYICSAETNIFRNIDDRRELRSIAPLARNRKFESISLQQRDAMGRAARMAISSLTSIDGVPRCPSRTI